MLAGTKLGPYEIVSLLGKGGMGEVYRAHDARVGREVAVKVSSERFGERFEREARAIASLNHPNICTLYDVGPNYLVMELVEGEPPQGPMPLDEALRIARQIASALQEAHAKSIVHRDLKPGNIRVKADGTVKVLDFGLAKMGTAPAKPTQDSPTLSIAATQAGMILGTAAYMSPEQARGREADKRSDIWAFGVVLYELLTGRQLFEGETISDVLAGVLRQEPDWSPVPEKARRLVQRCLEKDPKRRLQDIGDMDLLLEPQATGVAAQPPTRSTRIWPVAAAVLGLAAAVVSYLHFSERPPRAEVTRFEISPPEKTSFSSSFAISPDGRMLAFTAAGSDGRSRIWLKPMDSLEARPLNGTDGAQNPVIWSPDNRALAFSGGTLGFLKRIDVSGGPAQTLCSVSAGAPIGAWSSSGVIIFRDIAGISQVQERGGACSGLTVIDSQRGEIRHTSPSFLPDGRHFLYLRVGKLEETGVYVGSLDSKPDAQSSQRLLAGNSPATYASLPGASTGHLLFLRDGTLMAQPFNPSSLTFTGDARPVTEGVGFASGGDLPLFSVSATGTLVYRGTSGTQRLQLTWYDRKGESLGVIGDPGTYSAISLSPDGKRLAFDLPDSSANRDVWIQDLVGGTKNRFTFDLAPDFDPVWSADNKRVFFTSNREGGGNLYQKASDLTGNDQPVLKSPDRKFPQDVSPDGRFLMYVVISNNSQLDLWFLPLQGVAADEGKPRPFLATQFSENAARFSPDGHFVVYVSNETGKYEVYVRPFLSDGTPGGPQMISQGGGSQPLWRGNEIFYIAPDSKVMAVKVTTGATFQRGQPVALFTAPVFGGGGVVNVNTRWDVSPDGQKFIINTIMSEGSSTPVTAILNWAESLR
jgi:serine/threonine protein kinase